MLKRTLIVILSIALLDYAATVSAVEDSARVQALTRQVNYLSAQVEELKSAVELLNAIRPNVTTLMPNIAERMHVMHRNRDNTIRRARAGLANAILHIVVAMDVRATGQNGGRKKTQNYYF